MGSTHAASGALAGVAVAGLLGTGSVVEVAASAAVGAGAALLPDLDHPQATATRSQGPASQALSRGVRALSSAVWRATATKYDWGGRDRSGTHRHLTHTVPAALVAGLLVGVATLHWLGAAVVLWLLVSLGLRQCLTGRDREALTEWAVVTWGAGLATAVVLAVAPPDPVLLGVVVAVGMVAHDLGDAMTTSGAPLAWPIRVRGARWRMLGTPRWARFDAGHCWQETCVRWVCWAGTPAAALLMI